MSSSLGVFAAVKAIALVFLAIPSVAGIQTVLQNPAFSDGVLSAGLSKADIDKVVKGFANLTKATAQQTREYRSLLEQGNMDLTDLGPGHTYSATDSMGNPKTNLNNGAIPGPGTVGGTPGAPGAIPGNKSTGGANGGSTKGASTAGHSGALGGEGPATNPGGNANINGAGTRSGSGTSGGGAGSGGGSSSGGGVGCFTGDTLVRMADGSQKPIGQIKVGDQVMAFDEFGALTPEPVTQVFVHQNNPVVSLNGVRVTTVHRFLTKDGSYKAVGDLVPGKDILVAEDGSLVPEWTITPVEGSYTVYNLTVAQLHTYVAGGFRVHNRKVQ